MEDTNATRAMLTNCLPLVVSFLYGTMAIAQSATELPDAAESIVCSRSVMVSVNGPRTGEAPSRYFNVQGLSSRGNAKFASFGLLDFDLKADESGDSGTSRKLTLVLTQSIPPFAKSGRLLFFIPRDPDEDIAGMKFAAEGDTALGDATSRCIPCGEAMFTSNRTGQKDRLDPVLPEEARLLVDRIVREGGRLRILVVPGAADVAATYFGVDQSAPENRPHIIVE